MTADRLPVPHIDPALVAYLEQQFPDRSPSVSMTEKEVWFAAGGNAPIRHLRRLLEDQSENILESTHVFHA